MKLDAGRLLVSLSAVAVHLVNRSGNEDDDGFPSHSASQVLHPACRLGATWAFRWGVGDVRTCRRTGADQPGAAQGTRYLQCGPDKRADRCLLPAGRASAGADQCAAMEPDASVRPRGTAATRRELSAAGIDDHCRGTIATRGLPPNEEPGGCRGSDAGAAHGVHPCHRRGEVGCRVRRGEGDGRPAGSGPTALSTAALASIDGAAISHLRQFCRK